MSDSDDTQQSESAQEKIPGIYPVYFSGGMGPWFRLEADELAWLKSLCDGSLDAGGEL